MNCFSHANTVHMTSHCILPFNSSSSGHTIRSFKRIILKQQLQLVYEVDGILLAIACSMTSLVYSVTCFHDKEYLQNQHVLLPTCISRHTVVNCREVNVQWYNIHASRSPGLRCLLICILTKSSRLTVMSPNPSSSHNDYYWEIVGHVF